MSRPTSKARHGRVTRRMLVKNMVAAGFAPWVAAASRLPPAQAAGASGQIIFSGYGADYQDNIRKYVIDPFERQFNAKVIFDTQGSANEKAAKIRAFGRSACLRLRRPHRF